MKIIQTLCLHPALRGKGGGFFYFRKEPPGCEMHPGGDKKRREPPGKIHPGGDKRRGEES